MAKTFKVGDHVGWNSEAGHVTGIITHVYTSPFKVNGYTRHASKDNPQYAIKSMISDHVAHHFASALHKLQNGGEIQKKSYNPNLAQNDLAFQQWYKNNTLEGKNNIPYSPQLDYDYYSYYKNGDYKNYKGGHFPDTYKRPNEPTFSDESIYSVPDSMGGHWQGDIFIPYKQQNGGFNIPKFTPDKPVVDNLNPLAIAAPTMQQELARLNTRPQETVRQITPEEYNKSASIRDIISNPVTALKYKLHNQEIPSNFAKGERNVYDNAIDIINPATYINSAVNTVNRLAHPVNTVNQIVDNPVQNGLSALGDAAIFAAAVPKPLLKNTLNKVSSLVDDVNYAINKPATVADIKPKWFQRELGTQLPENGNFNQGVYNLKRFPDYVAKIENASNTANRMGYPDYTKFNFVDAMRNIPDNAPIAKVYNQLPIDRTNRALIMRKLEGLSPDKLMPEDYMSLPEKSITSLYNNLKLLKDNNLAFDYMGDNYLYNPQKQEFQLFDINPQFPKTNANSIVWNNHVLLNVNKDNPNLSPDLMRRIISNKLIQDYDRSLYKNYYNQQTSNIIGDASRAGTQYIKSAVNNYTKDLTEFKTGGQTMKNKKIKKFQFAGSLCGEGTIWDGEKCVPAPVNPYQPQMYEMQTQGDPTTFAQHTTTKQSGQVVASNVVPLHNINAMGPFNYANGQLQDQPNYQFNPKAGVTDNRGTFIPDQQVLGDAIDNGFNLDSDGVYRKKEITQDKNALGFSDGFKLLNGALDLTSLIAGKVNDAKTLNTERQRLLKARYSQAQYNPYENGVNNVPVYMKTGGGIDIKKSHEGLFTNEAKQANMSVQEFASHVLANKDKYSTAVVKRAVFAHNFAHQNGGPAQTNTLFNNNVLEMTKQKEFANNALINYANNSIKPLFKDPLLQKQYLQNSLNGYNDAKQNANNIYNTVSQQYNNVVGNLPQFLQIFTPKVKENYNFTDGYQQGGLINNTGYTPGTSTYNNPINIIPSENITMFNTPFPVMAYPNNGQPILMHPGKQYKFKGAKYVTEVPAYQQGGQRCPPGVDCSKNAEGYLPPALSKAELNKLTKQEKEYIISGQYLIDRAGFMKNNLNYYDHPAHSFDPQPSQNGVYYGPGNNIIFNNDITTIPHMVDTVAQNGGQIPLSPGQQQGQIEAEAGEILQSPQGQISKIPDTDPTHEQGGSLQNNVQRVLEDTGDKRNDKVSKLLRITPTQAEQLVGFKPKSTLTHSKLYEQATEFYGKKLAKLENSLNTNLDYINNNGGVYAKRSLDLNLKLLKDMPTKGNIFDTIYNHQEATKQAYGIDNQNQQQKFGGKVKFAIGGNPGDDIDPYTGGKTKKGRTTPTGLDNAFSYDGGLQAYKEAWKRAGLNLDQYKTNADAQSAVYDYLLKTHPQTIADMWQTYGNTNAGLKAGLPKTFTNEYLSNPDNLKSLKQAYVDGMFGVRTLTPNFMPEITIQGNKTPVEQQSNPYLKPNSIVPSKFNEPLHWYDVAGNTAAYLDANERTPVNFEQLNRQPLQLHELNPQPTISANNADFSAAVQQLPLNGVGFANQANLYANKYKANDQVFGQYENQNKQMQGRVDEINNANKFQLDQTNLNLRDRAQQQQLQGMEAQRLSKLNALDDLFTKIAQNNKLNREGNLVLQMTPFFDQNGEFNGNKYTLKVDNSGALNVVDKTTGKTVQTVSRDANGQITGSKYRTEQVNK